MSLNREQYNEIMRVISQRQNEAYDRQRSRQEEVEGQLPAVRIYNEKIAELSVKEVKASLGRGHADIEELKREREELNLRKRKLLKDAGFGEDYLDLKFYCGKCHDTGYIGREKCGCFKRLETELLNRESGLSALLVTENFGTYDPNIYDRRRDIKELLPKHMTQYEYMNTVVMNEIRNFVDNFGNGRGSSILMMGPPGTGKTFLSNCIAGTLIDRQHTVMYERAGDLIDAFSAKDFGRKNAEEAAARIERLEKSELLIIDDLGTEYTNDYSRSKLNDIISGRLTRGISTIISTNLSLNQLSSIYGERVTSRFIGGYRLIPFYGTDLRIRKTGGEIK